jgi:hypothetical protein
MLAFQLREEPFYPLALQVFLRPAQIAGNDGKTHRLRKRRNVALGGVAKRTNDDVLAVIGDQFGRHGARLAGEEHAHQQGFDQVVTVVAERDLAASQVWAACGASFSPIATTSPRR